METHRNSGLAAAILLLFVVSGFSGLIYQSIWTQYLGLVLGHAAYAQSLVLAIFMGGMAVGAWVVSQRTRGIVKPILLYAIVEALIGIFGIMFHGLFEAYSAFSQDLALPALGPIGLSGSYQWLSASLLILPQCFLLGATFPLLSAGYLRLTVNQEGAVLGGLYFSNSIGAAFGALVTTFAILPLVGLPGSMLTAGLLNLLVALGAWTISKRRESPSGTATPATRTASATNPAGDPTASMLRLVLWSTALSGGFSFAYEIGWIRMLNQALGSTMHSFELMLSAFIFGLAFGGLWVRWRSEKLGNALLTAGYAQVGMGIAALVSIVCFANSFAWVGWLMTGLDRSPEGYTLYSIGTAVIASVIMFPAAFFAGTTLPLFSLTLLRHGHGESSIGRVYAANTLGAIVGVALTMHMLIPLLGLRLALTLAAVGDILIGLILLTRAGAGASRVPHYAAGATAMAALVFSLAAGTPDIREQTSGVFRHGSVAVNERNDVVYLRDGKTATISVKTSDNKRYGAIATNGKTDASLAISAVDAPGADEITMLMLGALPLALHSDPQRIAAIGWGSGLTTHTILGGDRPNLVETIEIEPAIVDGARLFGERVQRAYADPRSKLIIDDARSHFARSHELYDVVVSEPSNPWVNGVAGLFTHQFYTLLDQKLAKDGLLLQWLHTYELSDQLLAQMLRAMLDVFQHVDLYLANSDDFILVASQSPINPLTLPQSPALAAELKRVGLSEIQDYTVRRVGGTKTLEVFCRLFSAASHSDYYPTVALNAPRDRFEQKSSSLLQALAWNGIPVLDLLLERQTPARSQQVTNAEFSIAVSRRNLAIAALDSLRSSVSYEELPANAVEDIILLKALSRSTIESSELAAWADAMATVAYLTVGQLAPEDFEESFASLLGLEATQPALALELAAAYTAIGRRDTAVIATQVTTLLNNRDFDLPNRVKIHLLLAAMSVAASSGDFAEVRALDTQHGSNFEPGSTATAMRSYLLAWADE